jgi:DeoR/GlpR family transcriptional regulator of sugar metabolism
MYSADRRREILAVIEKDASVSVIQLANRLSVSRASIRRDLNELADSGLVQRTHGGAVKAVYSETPFSERATAHREEKVRIGKAAASYVVPGDTIFMDGGTTVECMTGYLANIPRLTVVTWALNIVTRLVGMENITVIVSGGTLHHTSLFFGGSLALGSMQGYGVRCDKAFLAAGAISSEAGVTNASFEEIPLKRKAIELSRETFLMVDSSKVGAVRPAQIVPVEKITHLITGRDAPEMEVNNLRQLGLIVDLV